MSYGRNNFVTALIHFPTIRKPRWQLENHPVLVVVEIARLRSGRYPSMKYS